MLRISSKNQVEPEKKERQSLQVSSPILLLLLLLGLLPVACRPGPQAAAARPPATETAVVLLSATLLSTPAPVIVSPGTTPATLPAFTLPTAAPPTVTASPTTTPTITVTAPPLTSTEVISQEITTAGIPTATPGPTFTPPAKPETSSNEHYWLNRPVATGGVVWTNKHYPYGSTRGGQLRAHHGVEFDVPYNTEILAAGSGTVRVAGGDDQVAYGPHTNFYGNLVVIEHGFQINGQPVFTLYGHLNQALVAEGQQVGAQAVIGLSGATGVADGPHVHFEVRVGANSYEQTRNPLLWLYPFPDRGTIAGRVVWPDGSLAMEAPVSLNRIDGSAPYLGTTTYPGNSVNADPAWNENFVLDDVPAGYYEVIVNAGSKKVKVETWVYPQRTSFVEIVLQP